jgi:integrase
MVFQMRFYHAGKQQRMDIGTYPLISLKQARNETLRFRSDLEKGIDPRITKKTDKLKNIESSSLEVIFNKWHEAWCLPNKKGAEDIKRSFEIHIFPRLGEMPPDRVSTDNWLSLLESIKKKTPGIAERLLINAKQLLAWSLRRHLITTNALAGISAKADLNIVKRSGTRSLSDDEIGYLFLALAGSRMAAKNKCFIRLCLIYGCRSGELRLAKKADFDFDKQVWTIPAANHKTGKATGKPLLRPIVPATQVILEDCFNLTTGDYLFTNAGSKTKPMGQSASLSLPYNLMQWLRKNKDINMMHWSIHDLRKTARTNFSTLTQPHIAEIILGHKLPGQWAVYDHYDYLPEQAECLLKWCKRLHQFEPEQTGL